MSWCARGLRALAVALTCLMPGASAGQPAPAAPLAGANPADQSRLWIVLGGASTTLRGDCGECEVETSYLNTGSLLANVGYRVNTRMDAGAEVFWVPATSTVGEPIRSTFLVAAAQFRPWESRGFFLKAGMGIAFVRNWVFEGSGELPPYTTKGLGLTYGAGWAFRRTARVGVQMFGAQHVAALGDLQTSTAQVENVVGNFWSAGAAVVIR